MTDHIIPITKPYFDKFEMEKVKQCLDSGWVTQGPMVSEFEDKFKCLHNSEYAAAVSSCTAALHLAMLALGIGVGDEVLVPAFTWVTSASCVEYVGATPVFVDVEQSTFNMDPALIEKAITEKTKAIIVVHLFGCSAKMNEIMSIAGKYGLKVVEDCACAIGTTYHGKPAGTIGDIGCFSFHPRKAITTGEGGMCSTNNKNLYAILCQLRNHGGKTANTDEEYGKPYYMGKYDMVGFNLRLSDIQAAVGIAQFDKINFLLENRKRCAKHYLENLSNNNDFILPDVEGCLGHTYQSFVIIDKKGRLHRNNIMDKLSSCLIQSRPGTLAVHRLDYFKDKYGIREDKFPNAVICEDNSITLPVFWDLSNCEMDKIIRLIIE